MSHRKSTRQKAMEGTLRPSRTNPNEPEAIQGIPTPPAHLSARAKTAWRVLSEQLDQLGVMATSDGLALEGLCESYADLLQARESLAKHDGATTYKVTTKAGGTMHRAYPEVAQISDADKRVREWLARFGLTPADRSRVEARPTNTESPWAKFRIKVEPSLDGRTN